MEQHSYTPEQRLTIWLSRTPGMSIAEFYALINRFGSAAAVYEDIPAAEPLVRPAVCSALSAPLDNAEIDGFFENMERRGIAALTHLHDDYPDALRFIKSPPPTLYLRGGAAGWRGHCVAVVGSRKATKDGISAAHDIARGLGESGVAVVSGLAYGIDTAAHNGCMDGRGRTIAVLAGGVDQPGSYEAADLSDRIVDTGGAVVSEYPPGMPAMKHHFPVRNRIISGLSSGVLLVEGAEGSGALITLKHASSQGRARFALPNSIYQANSFAPNLLLRDGAIAVVSAEDILNYFGWPVAEHREAAPPPPRLALDPRAEAMVEMLGREQMSFDELADFSGLNAASLNSLLTILQARGIIEQLPGKLYRARLLRTF